MEHRNAASSVLELSQQRALKNTTLTAVFTLLTTVAPGLPNYVFPPVTLELLNTWLHQTSIESLYPSFLHRRRQNYTKDFLLPLPPNTPVCALSSLYPSFLQRSRQNYRTHFLLPQPPNTPVCGRLTLFCWITAILYQPSPEASKSGRFFLLLFFYELQSI